MRELGYTKVTTTQMYADFEDTVDIDKEFPSIVNTSIEPIFDKEYTKIKGTNMVDTPLWAYGIIGRNNWC